MAQVQAALMDLPVDEDNDPFDGMSPEEIEARATPDCRTLRCLARPSTTCCMHEPNYRRCRIVSRCLGFCYVLSSIRPLSCRRRLSDERHLLGTLLRG